MLEEVMEIYGLLNTSPQTHAYFDDYQHGKLVKQEMRQDNSKTQSIHYDAFNFLSREQQETGREAIRKSPNNLYLLQVVEQFFLLSMLATSDPVKLCKHRNREKSLISEWGEEIASQQHHFSKGAPQNQLDGHIGHHLEFRILIMWLFGVPKSSIAVIIIAILLFAEMNAIASLKLQSFNNSKAHVNFIYFDGNLGLLGTARVLTTLSLPSLGSIAGLAGAAGLGLGIVGLGLGAGLLAGLGSRFNWKSTKSSQNVVSNGRGSPYHPLSAGASMYCLFVGYGYNGVPYYFSAPCNYYYGYYG
ncbi:hypothetical protein DINM_006093 [Dirofilaria immitis]|nr:hypothetical protein [Dirofilaria immitis]